MHDPRVFLFPGQGAQFVGMGKSLLSGSPRARRILERGDAAFGGGLLRVCHDGPEEELHSTRVSQPAIFVLSMAALEALAERFDGAAPFGRDLPAAAAAGLSLGEYSALVFAGCIEFEDALRVVIERGRAMQEACDEAPGGMVSLLGIAVPEVEKAVDAARAAGRIGIANYNSSDQTVISGDLTALDAAVARAKELGCRRAIPLKVAGAYHSPLMASATRALRPRLEALEIRAPRCPFYSNVTGARVEDPEAIREGLLAQIERSVRWSQILEKLAAKGPRQALEVGPGKVLKGLFRNVDKDFAVESLCELDSLEAYAAKVAAV